MSFRTAWIVFGACAAIAFPRPISAEELAVPARRVALGFNLDLLPTILSAANGRPGYAPQVWLGVGHARIRFVCAHLEPPNAFAFAPSGFRRPTTTAFASVIDYTFGARFDGPWIGSGVEVWQSSIEHDGVAGTARWTSTVFTVGGGHIWRSAGDLFLDPQSISLGGFDYRPFPLQGEISLKVGWFLSI